MDPSKCSVVVVTGESHEALGREALMALVEAREAHLRYRILHEKVQSDLVITFVLGVACGWEPRNVLLWLLGWSLAGAAMRGLVARSARREFDRAARPP